VELVAEDSGAITGGDVFDVYSSLLKHSDNLQGPIMNKILDSISSGLAAQVESTTQDLETGDQDSIREHKKAIEMYAFLLQWFVVAAEKVKKGSEDDAPVPAAKPRRGRGGARAASTRKQASTAWSWEDQIPSTLALISKVLRLSSQRIWTTTSERDTFIRFVRASRFRHVTFILGFQLYHSTCLSRYGK
jgi:condensin complex subunit 1